MALSRFWGTLTLLDLRHLGELARRLVRYRKLTRFLTAIHVAVFRWTEGRLGGRVAGLPVLLLTTRGRHTLLRRTVPLCYLPLSGEEGTTNSYAVVASNGGADRCPAWWLNLQECRSAEIQIKGRSFTVVAEEIAVNEFGPLWEEFCQCFPGYEVYEAATERPIPIVRLTQY